MLQQQLLRTQGPHGVAPGLPARGDVLHAAEGTELANNVDKGESKTDQDTGREPTELHHRRDSDDVRCLRSGQHAGGLEKVGAQKLQADPKEEAGEDESRHLQHRTQASKQQDAGENGCQSARDPPVALELPAEGKARHVVEATSKSEDATQSEGLTELEQHLICVHRILEAWSVREEPGEEAVLKAAQQAKYSEPAEAVRREDVPAHGAEHGGRPEPRQEGGALAAGGVLDLQHPSSWGAERVEDGDGSAQQSRKEDCQWPTTPPRTQAQRRGEEHRAELRGRGAGQRDAGAELEADA
mmetsp:Transcript_117860/g.306000  ORF Transcript_117860/g.306000 Transcript_117860/m.306000 type:complete len:299 (+) Transcript_117860:1731-2627(+)